MHTEYHARLFRNGSNQAIRIPREFELPGEEVIIRRQGLYLLIEPVKKPNKLSALLTSWLTCEEEFPEIIDLPADDVNI
jgi:antitoxin VapB